ncbi:MAG: kinase [Hydrocarboniphaga sp.]|uniref:NAD(+)/NADH kinase n=1 Tax=Hydrocarboniphaga sp. TaxID=2033016 RepID=UPI00262ABF93|nr:NAD(+)/NADH kinase [Hydrocarboniphaga sp.]MDB5970694.1 kinase [Hydrocarboniphaga sp.]
MKPFRTVGVIGKRREPHLPTLASLCLALRAQGCEVLVEDNAALAEAPAGRRVSRQELARSVELAIVVGGDGTLLDAGRSMAPAGVPLLGVNQGRLGFMADLLPEQIADSLAAVIRGEYETEERMVLSARIIRAGGDGSSADAMPRIAINDVVLRNQASIRMLEFESWMDEDFISLHRADGMIVCSPTGSTAYALSGGGPLMHPSLQAMALVPICPHTLSDRPIVVGGEQRVRLVVCGDETLPPTSLQAMMTIDGQIGESLATGDAVEITRGAAALRLIHPAGYSYFAILRNKLRWGRGQTVLER